MQSFLLVWIKSSWFNVSVSWSILSYLFWYILSNISPWFIFCNLFNDASIFRFMATNYKFTWGSFWTVNYPVSPHLLGWHRSRICGGIIHRGLSLWQIGARKSITILVFILGVLGKHLKNDRGKYIVVWFHLGEMALLQ